MEMTEEMFVELNMLKDDNPAIFSKRIRLSSEVDPALIMFIPDEGNWKAVISNGSEMVQISFQSEEKEE